MKIRLIPAAAAVFASAMVPAVHAGGLDRSYTPIDVIFEKGNYAEAVFVHVAPDATGRDVLGNSYGNVAGGKTGFVGAAVKMDIGGPLSLGLIYDRPYGNDILYGGNPATTMLGGTKSDAKSHAVTALLKYQANERISFYGGPRWLEMEGDVTLSGRSSGPLNGYNLKLASDSGIGYVLGAAYEIPDIAFRASLTYHSAIDLHLPTTQTFPGAPAVTSGNTNIELPQSMKLALQSGIAKDTLLFGSVRRSQWSAFTLNPPALGPGVDVPNIVNLDDVTTWELGLGYRFSEKFTSRISIDYEKGASGGLAPPLKPQDGRIGVSIGGKYQITQKVALSAGVRYEKWGDANIQAGPAGVVASFPNNGLLGVGLKLGVSF